MFQESEMIKIFQEAYHQPRCPRCHELSRQQFFLSVSRALRKEEQGCKCELPVKGNMQYWGWRPEWTLRNTRIKWNIKEIHKYLPVISDFKSWL